MKPCCHASGSQRNTRAAASPIKRILGALEWVVPGAIFVAIPKCPACVAAYIALATGMGVSLSTAAHLRLLGLALCGGALAYVAAKRLVGLVSRKRQISN